MNFRFDVKLTDEDYLEFNKFHVFKSPYTQKLRKAMKVCEVICLCCFLISAVSCFAVPETENLILGVFVAVLCLAICLLYPKFMVWSIKMNLKSLKQKGKLAYSPVSVIEFHDEYFAESTETNTTQQKYTSIERISIVGGKNLYIHTNSVAGYIIPLACFESAEQYNSFMEFIKTKCSTIDIYK